MRIARVIVDSPLPQLDRLLDYRIPDGPEGIKGIEPGVRVQVPLRSAKRLAGGFVVETADSGEYPGPLSDVAALVSPVRVLQPEVWALARAVADRAAGSASDVLRIAIPKRQARVEKSWLERTAGPSLPEIAAPAVTGYPEGSVEEVVAGRRRAALGAQPGVARTRAGRWVGQWALTLVEAAAQALARNESAIIAAPDQRDEEQLLAAAADLLPPEAVVRWDARQTDPERYRGLLRAAAAPALVIGNRSAVYAPAARLGLIAVWDDGDELLGEPLSPYVHARDAALVRQEQQGSALLLAGHVRTAETQRLVELGWLGELSLERPHRIRTVPTASQSSEEPLAARGRIPSFAWRTAREALERGPVLVQVSRPGYTTGLRCAECGSRARCRRCGGPLRERSAAAQPSCGWCGALEPAWRCPQCESTRLRPGAPGASRTADELGRAFPGARIVVADGERPLFEVDDRPALVVATRGAEPLAAGGYRAVLLLDGDRMLQRESLRVGEDCLRWWANAAALSADDGIVVLVGVEGALARALATGRVVEHAAAELADRRALRFPPAVRVATIEGFPDAVAAALAALPDGVELIGSAPHEERERAIIRFDYAKGAAVAAAVRAEIVRQATAHRKRMSAGPPHGRRPLPLRARFDDPSPFEE